MNPSDFVSDYLADEDVASKLKAYITSLAWHPLRLNRADREDRVADIYNDVCLVALKKAKDGLFDPSRNTAPIAWLMQIAVFVVKSHQRDDAREWNRTTSEEAMEPGKWEEALAIDMSADERIEEVFDALGKLTPRLREAFVLRYMDQLKGDALAQRLGVGQSSATVMVSQAKKRLLNLLKQARGVTQ